MYLTMWTPGDDDSGQRWAGLLLHLLLRPKVSSNGCLLPHAWSLRGAMHQARHTAAGPANACSIKGTLLVAVPVFAIALHLVQ